MHSVFFSFHFILNKLSILIHLIKVLDMMRLKPKISILIFVSPGLGKLRILFCFSYVRKSAMSGKNGVIV